MYVLEFFAILIGVMLFRKYIYRRKTPFDQKAIYKSVMAAIYIWTIWTCMGIFGVDLGFVLGLIAGAIAVYLLEGTIGFLNNAGY
ncbi:hypothetical protein CUJ83_00275 [Methanocella sp. CWC-04]|uniref:Uncharacterized protein n=1 Tax=Methanooceanicella nereidis TaxID=2052831 RepID=A0AAP2R9K9_9EURY|nr:hypothetical protein [Methanocella sp. CWC-04]